MTKKMLRTTALSAGIFMFATLDGNTQDSRIIDLPAQPLGNAISALSSKTGLSVVVEAGLVEGKTSRAVIGEISSHEALKTMVEGSGLQVVELRGSRFALKEVASSLDDDADVLLDEILITARRTEESLFDVPASVVVVSGTQIQRSGLDRAEDIALVTPNFNTVGGAPGTREPSVRGIANEVGISATSPSVGVFVDGVITNPTAALAGVSQPTLDLERVETVLGPSNNNFGRGTVGGAVNFVTKKPTNEFEASFTGDIGSFPDGKGTFVVNAPIIEDGLLSARLAFSGAASDGFVSVGGDGPDQIGTEDYSLRFSLRSKPTDRLTLDSSFSFDRNQFDAFGSATFSSIESSEPVFPGDSPSEATVDRFLVKGEAKYETSIGDLVFRANYLKNDFSGSFDTDLTALDLTSETVEVIGESISGEARFQGDEFNLPSSLGTVSINSGFSLNSVDLSVTDEDDPGEALFLSVLGAPDDGSSVIASIEQDVLSFGIFSEGRWKPIPKLEIAAGVRFNLDNVSQESESVTSGLTSLLLPAVPFEAAEETFTAFTPNASIKYDWTDDFSTYFAYSTGFRAGGFILIAGVDLFPFEEETADQFEVGFRSNFFDDRLSVSGNAFILNVENFQSIALTTVAGFTFVGVENFDTENRGVELQISAEPIDGLRINAGYGFLDSEFADGSISAAGADVSGDRPAFSPAHSFNLAGEHSHPISQLDADAFLRAEYYFQTDFVGVSAAELDDVEGFDTLNFRAGLRGDNFELVGFVENALNEGYATGLSIPIFGDAGGEGVLGFAGPTRRFGVQGKLTF
ncbi:MAG: TonB-dependent receptor [Pseudomonadota bacterium]